MAHSKASTTQLSGPAESLFSRMFITPLLFISFIISLFLIDKQTYSQVLSDRTPNDQYYHSRQRKIAKQEIDDAFHLRNRVLAAMSVFCGVGLAVLGWSGKTAYDALFRNTNAV